jgi:hypothetical protein
MGTQYRVQAYLEVVRSKLVVEEELARASDLNE